MGTLRRADKAMILLTLLLLPVLLVMGSRGVRSSSTMVLRSTFVGPEVAASIPDGGQVLVVSDYCDTCRDRHAAYARAVERGIDIVLVAEISPDSSVFARYRQADTELASRVILLDRSAFADWMPVSAVPASLTVDRAGRVQEWGLAQNGSLRAVLRPSRWVEGWRRLVGRPVS